MVPARLVCHLPYFLILSLAWQQPLTNDRSCSPALSGVWLQAPAINQKKGGGKWSIVWALRLAGCGSDCQFIVCYWEMVSSSWAGFKSTTVVPRREAPPSPSDDDDGWEFLMAPPPVKQQDTSQIFQSRGLEWSSMFSLIRTAVTLPCRGGGRRQSEDVGTSSPSSVGLWADIGVACGGLLLVMVTVQLVFHQEDENEDEDGCHNDPPNDDDHGTTQELKKGGKKHQNVLDRMIQKEHICSGSLIPDLCFL